MPFRVERIKLGLSFCDRNGDWDSMQRQEYLEWKIGYRTALLDGTMVPESPKHMATERFYHAQPGSRLALCREGYVFAVAVFGLEREPRYMYSYDYQREENWAAYTRNVTPTSYQSEDYVFDRECFFRVCVKRQDGRDLDIEDYPYVRELMLFYHEELQYEDKDYFVKEAEETIATIQGYDAGKQLRLCLLADTHYTINGTWEDTAHNIFKVSRQAAYDGIVHLGDFTDGMVAKNITRSYVKRIFEDLDKCGVPVYAVVGNHDSNYFRNCENTFTIREMQELYRLPGESLDYYVDIPDYGVRMIFLSSFDNNEPIRYGYKEQQLVWLRQVLYSAERGTRFLIFSHDAPLAQLDYWSCMIQNGERLLDILEECNAGEDYRIVGFFYGHVHGDYCYEGCSFPVISIGCAKLEAFPEKKPEGLVVYDRQAGTVTQDLWDSLLVDFAGEKLKLVRFGAGKDREISFARKESTYKEAAKRKMSKRRIKVWAHRGASGYAPENTLPAFRLANALGADGIELDVQLTKDGVPVVIHDESVERVCDGMGMVRNYTLQELKQLNAAKNFPSFGRVSIPTLEEVYDYVKTTDMLVNLELKNGVFFYEGLEEKVLQLAAEKGISDRVVYSSFNHHSMIRIKELQPDARIAFLYGDGILDIADYARKYAAYAVHPALKNMQYPNIVEQCHENGIRVHVWTVNEPADIERMKELDVDAVITNYVDRA